MELKIIDKTNDELSLEIKGEDHTFLNMLKFILLEDDRVNIATYDIKHVSISDPVLYMKTEGYDPIEVIRDALSNMSQECDEFLDAFSKTVN
ncbi:DNA-directed RNA polymerase subunit L [Methanosalsum natronophilum]|uniref:DNA-directed RNA polymerase subunit Rpo11 n=1 Tax=Methanosalsum natronophilum TaxID=768733 RepID=A0A3R7YIY3_9EURY|nr:DNA-directed RNA polymerase subunit L [Methanosalsum natronophilum]MCS3923538.1 DNA-directed RNA polymerase subunit L [Methanosalsum natronophilum]RQD87875.1 MAG: DNA-directed RNA polymerase subunit L [Methanosalsum natronophilum]